MDLLGTKRAVEIMEKSLGIVIPKGEADLVKLGEALDASGVFFGEITEVAKHANEIMEVFPAQWHSLVKAGLGFIDHMVRVGTQASLAAQDAKRTSTEARDLLAAIHDKGFKISIGQ